MGTIQRLKTYSWKNADVENLHIIERIRSRKVEIVRKECELK